MKKVNILVTIVLAMIFNLVAVPTVPTAKAESINITSSDPSVIISEPMTGEELAWEFSKNENVSYEEAIKILFPEYENKSSYSISSNFSITGNNYRTLEKTVSSTAGRVFFYCNTSESGLYHGIVKVLHAGYYSGAKKFDGSFFYHLVNANRIDFILNGHLYNTGTTTVSGGGSIGIGQSANASVNISYATDYYAPLYTSQTLNW